MGIFVAVRDAESKDLLFVGEYAPMKAALLEARVFDDIDHECDPFATEWMVCSPRVVDTDLRMAAGGRWRRFKKDAHHYLDVLTGRIGA